jgi:thiamine biosynthesis lipoprotein
MRLSAGLARHRVRDVMGMPVTVHVVDAAAEESWLDEVYADFASLDQTFSRFHSESAVNRINRGELLEVNAAPLVRQAIDLCRLYQQATEGYFSAWIKGTFDPSGLVKGWAIDRAATILAEKGCRNFYVDAGGDIQARGRNEDGSPWRVGIRHPVERDKVARVILAADLAVATSGTYEKGEHIVNPHTEMPVAELLSFTVVGPDILSADVYATAAFAMGESGLAFIDGVAGYEGFAISRSLTAAWTAGFDGYCAAAG